MLEQMAAQRVASRMLVCRHQKPISPYVLSFCMVTPVMVPTSQRVGLGTCRGCGWAGNSGSECDFLHQFGKRTDLEVSD